MPKIVGLEREPPRMGEPPAAERRQRTPLEIPFAPRERITTRNTVDPLDPLIAGRIAGLISADPIAASAYRQLQQHGTELILEFGLGPSRLMGKADVCANRVTVYARNHPSAEEIVSTIVHESSHIHRYFRGSRFSQLDEVRARSREFLYREGRRPDREERGAIWREVEELADYADLPRRSS